MLEIESDGFNRSSHLSKKGKNATTGFDRRFACVRASMDSVRSKRVDAARGRAPLMMTARGLVDCAVRRPRRREARGQQVASRKLDLSLQCRRRTRASGEAPSSFAGPSPAASPPRSSCYCWSPACTTSLQPGRAACAARRLLQCHPCLSLSWCALCGLACAAAAFVTQSATPPAASGGPLARRRRAEGSHLGLLADGRIRGRRPWKKRPAAAWKSAAAGSF